MCVWGGSGHQTHPAHPGRRPVLRSPDSASSGTQRPRPGVGFRATPLSVCPSPCPGMSPARRIWRNGSGLSRSAGAKSRHHSPAPPDPRPQGLGAGGRGQDPHPARGHRSSARRSPLLTHPQLKRTCKSRVQSRTRVAIISNPKNSVLLEQPMEQLSLTLNDLLFPGVVPLNPNYHTW